jgi:hypothetical protein
MALYSLVLAPSPSLYYWLKRRMAHGVSVWITDNSTPSLSKINTHCLWLMSYSMSFREPTSSLNWIYAQVIIKSEWCL